MDIKTSNDRLIDLILSSKNAAVLYNRISKIIDYDIINNNNNDDIINNKINQIFHYMEYIYPKYSTNPMHKYAQSSFGLKINKKYTAGNNYGKIELNDDDIKQYEDLIKLLLMQIFTKLAEDKNNIQKF